MLEGADLMSEYWLYGFRMYDLAPKSQPLPNKTVETLGGEQGDEDHRQTKSLRLIEEVEEQIVWMDSKQAGKQATATW